MMLYHLNWITVVSLQVYCAVVQEQNCSAVHAFTNLFAQIHTETPMLLCYLCSLLLGCCNCTLCLMMLIFCIWHKKTFRKTLFITRELKLQIFKLNIEVLFLLQKEHPPRDERRLPEELPPRKRLPVPHLQTGRHRPRGRGKVLWDVSGGELMCSRVSQVKAEFIPKWFGTTIFLHPEILTLKSVKWISFLFVSHFCHQIEMKNRWWAKKKERKGSVATTNCVWTYK